MNVDNNVFFIFALILVAIISVVIGYMIGELGGGGRLSRSISKHFQKLIDSGYAELEATIQQQIDLLQSDLHVTATQMNSYVKEDLGRALKDESRHYKMAISSTRQSAIDSIKQQQVQFDKQDATLKEQYEISLKEVRRVALNNIKESQEHIEQQNVALRAQFAKELDLEKQRRIAKLEENMTDIIGSYVQKVISNKLELHEQLPIILADLQSSKTAMVEDITHGA